MMRYGMLQLSLGATLALTLAHPSWGNEPADDVARAPSTRVTPATPKADAPRAKPRWASGFGTTRDALIGTRPIILLVSPLVLEALQPSEEQRAKLRDLERAVTEGAYDAIKKSAKIPKDINSPAEDPFDRAMGEAMAVLRAKQEAAVARILTSGQVRRLWEIAIQVGGPLAVTWPEVQDRLNMSPNQRLQVRAILDGYVTARSEVQASRAKISRAFYDSHLDEFGEAWRRSHRAMLAEKADLFDELYGKEESLRAEVARQIGRVLTKRQARLLDEIGGEPFDTSEFTRPGGNQLQESESERYEAARKAKMDGEDRPARESPAVTGPRPAARP